MSETARKGSGRTDNGKVIITCAITGAIHTPTMSPLPADHPRPDRRRGDRRRRGRRRHLHLHAREPGDRQAGPVAGRVRPLPPRIKQAHRPPR